MSTKRSYILKGIVKWYTKWRWPNFSCLTVFEFINHYKVTFPQQEHVQIFPLPSPSKACALPFEKYLLLTAWRTEVSEPGPQFLLFDRHRYIHTESSALKFWSAYLCYGFNFFFVLKDLISRIDSYFQRIAFQRNLLVIGF